MLSRLPPPLARRLKYYRALATTDAVRLEAVFARTALDRQRAAFAAMLWRSMLPGAEAGEAADEGRAEAGKAVAPPPPPESLGMRRFVPALFSEGARACGSSIRCQRKLDRSL